MLQTTEARLDEDLVSELLYGNAHPLCGSGLDDASLVRIARKELAGRSFSIVRNWMILDVLLPESDIAELSLAGRYPMVLMAHDVAYESEASCRCERPLVTEYGHDFFGCFFEAGSKVYVLAGRGARRYTGKPALIALRQLIVGRGI